jgi:hypothetical protein
MTIVMMWKRQESPFICRGLHPGLENQPAGSEAAVPANSTALISRRPSIGHTVPMIDIRIQSRCRSDLLEVRKIRADGRSSTLTAIPASTNVISKPVDLASHKAFAAPIRDIPPERR